MAYAWGKIIPLWGTSSLRNQQKKIEKIKSKGVLETAKEKGKSTGLVATSEITHATPASFGAHDDNRKNMNAIADDYFDEMINGKHKIDVLLGGGTSNFIRPDRNLTEEFKKDGYSLCSMENQGEKGKMIA